MNINTQPTFSNMSNAFKGNDNYKIGFIFLVGYLLTFFSKMKINNVSKSGSFALLFFVSFFCSLFY